MFLEIYKEDIRAKEDKKTFLTNWEFDGSGGLLNDLTEVQDFFRKTIL
jgi:hypothetical protein